MNMSDASVRPLRAESGLLLVVAAVAYLADRLTKAWVVANIDIGEQVSVLGDVVQIWHTENSGAAFGLFQDAGVVFIVVGIAATAAVVWVHLTGRIRGAPAVALLGLVLGGALGNLTDRLIDGSVTDFISVGIGDWRWPTFNIADSSVFVGVVGLIIVLSALDRRAATHAA
jgi:signal peptidase II